MYSIGEVADLTGIGRHAIRLYEEAGFFVRPVLRDGHGNRRYDDEDVEWLRRCVVMRNAGMPVAEISAYVRLARAGAPDDERVALLRRHRDRVAAELRSAHDRLALMDGKLAEYADHLAAGGVGPPWPEASPALE